MCFVLLLSLYELFVGQPPFFTNSFYTLVHLIVENQVKYPPTMSDAFKDFLQGLLQKTPSKRLSWPHLANHPFIRETPEEEAARAEAIERVHVQQQYTIGANKEKVQQTPRTEESEVRGFGGVKKPATASAILQQQAAAQQAAAAAAKQQQQQHHPSHSHTARPVGSSTATTVAGSNSSSVSSHHGSSNGHSASSSTSSSTAVSSSHHPSSSSVPSHSRSNSDDSIRFDVSQLSQLLSPSSSSSIDTFQSTLNQFNHLLNDATRSQQVPSPLITLLPQLLSYKVPDTLVNCSLHLSHQGQFEGPIVESLVQSIKLMVHPEGNKVVLTPLHFEESSSGAGRTLPPFEVQLRRAMGDRMVLPATSSTHHAATAAGSGASTLYELLSHTFLTCVRREDLTSPSHPPSTLLSNLITIFFQCCRSSSASTMNGLIETISKDKTLLSGIVQVLHKLLNTPNTDVDDDVAYDGRVDSVHPSSTSTTTSRSRTCGRILFLLATLCGKVPTIVKLLVGSCGFEPIHIIETVLEHSNRLISIAGSFLASQLMTNSYAKLETLIASPLKLLQTVHGKIVLYSEMSIPTQPLANGDGQQAASAAGLTPLVPMRVTPICALEGTGLMYSLLGSLDGYFQLIQAILYFLTLQSSNNTNVHLISSHSLPQVLEFLMNSIWELVCQRLERLKRYKPIINPTDATDLHRTIAGEMSINGWMAFLAIALDLLKYNLKHAAASSSSSSSSSPSSLPVGFDTLLKGMCDLVSPQRISNLYSWPDGCGGGSSGVGLLLKRTLNVLYIPFTSSSSSPSSSIMLSRVQKLLFNETLIRRLLVGLKYLESPSEMELPVGFLAQLCMRSPYFERQFLEYQGLQLFSSKGVLNPESRTITSSTGVLTILTPSPALLTDAMHVITQFARSSSDHYPAIHEANFYADFVLLLSHSDAGVRAKTCNLIGNLFRHSSYFYAKLSSHHAILASLLASIGDSNSAVRKWSAFALGNAVFHDASLAPQVTKAIPGLLRMLSTDEDEKAAAHAAGVLANLLRHVESAEEMVRDGAVGALTHLVHQILSSNTPPTPIQLGCVRSAAFALGHLCAIESGRHALRQPSAVGGSCLDVLHVAMRSRHAQKDAKLQTYFQRIIAKVNNK